MPRPHVQHEHMNSFNTKTPANFHDSRIHFTSLVAYFGQLHEREEMPLLPAMFSLFSVPQNDISCRGVGGTMVPTPAPPNPLTVANSPVSS